MRFSLYQKREGTEGKLTTKFLLRGKRKGRKRGSAGSEGKNKASGEPPNLHKCFNKKDSHRRVKERPRHGNSMGEREKKKKAKLKCEASSLSQRKKTAQSGEKRKRKRGTACSLFRKKKKKIWTRVSATQGPVMHHAQGKTNAEQEKRINAQHRDKKGRVDRLSRKKRGERASELFWGGKKGKFSREGKKAKEGKKTITTRRIRGGEVAFVDIDVRGKKETMAAVSSSQRREKSEEGEGATVRGKKRFLTPSKDDAHWSYSRISGFLLHTERGGTQEGTAWSSRRKRHALP